MTKRQEVSGRCAATRRRSAALRAEPASQAQAKPAAANAVLFALAERAVQAAGPDPVLAAEIHCALRGYTIHEDTDPATGHFAFWEGAPWESPCVNCSSWSDPTASIDEAMALVPWAEMHEWGYRFALEEDWFSDDSDAWTARFDQRGDECGHGDTIIATAETPALAVTAASLRARAASCDRSGEADETATQIAGSAEGESAVPEGETPK